MDSKLIQQFGTEILSYRIRSARHKKRMQYKDFDKQLLKIDREEGNLYKQQRNLGWEPLIPPVQKGWKRFFVLREDVAVGRHAQFFEDILKKINTYDWSHRKDFMVKKRRFGRKKYAVKGQKLLQPDERHFNKLNFTDAEKQFFHEAYRYEKYGNVLVRYYVFNEPWRFVLRVRPNMIDRIRKTDPEIESRLKEIDNYLERNDCQNQIYKLKDGNLRWRYRPEKVWERNPFKNKSLPQILDAISWDDQCECPEVECR